MPGITDELEIPSVYTPASEPSEIFWLGLLEVNRGRGVVGVGPVLRAAPDLGCFPALIHRHPE